MYVSAPGDPSPPSTSNFIPELPRISRKGPGFVKQLSATLTLPQGLAEICDSYFEPALQGISEVRSPSLPAASQPKCGFRFCLPSNWRA